MDYLKIYTTLDSTNKEAQRLLAEGPVISGLTLLARHQTGGKGQMGRNWIAEPGSHLAMTIIYQPARLSPAELTTLGMKVSLGILKALLSIDPALNLFIKWPNDIYAGQKKLCGILIENSLSGGRVQHSIIGIGMNVNELHFPDEIPNAVSLFQLTGHTYDLEPIALSVRDHVLSILENEPAGWKATYDHYVFGKGQAFQFISNETTFEATVHGVTLEGHLMLQTADGHIRAFASHEVKWVIAP
jgi:BirA family biotin operon repressor/biotin-[acetyl-CoA-carboxylase] ligase